jgi:tRNA(Ile)-lysidine synthase
MAALGADETFSATVLVEAAGTGPEAAARQARYAVLEEIAERFDAAAVVLGHTRDDQAETVLLGLARGSGGRSLAGMRRSFDVFVRPLLDVARADTVTACQVEGVEFWDDPHNDDDAFTRVRVRNHVMPVLESELGPGVSDALARTAQLLQADDAALNEWAADVKAKAALHTEAGLALDAVALADAPKAVRIRVIRSLLIELGVPGGDLRASHLSDVDALVSNWKGQGEVHLPGSFGASRSCGRLLIARADR